MSRHPYRRDAATPSYRLHGTNYRNAHGAATKASKDSEPKPRRSCPREAALNPQSPTFEPEPTNLQALKLQFCILAKKIQGNKEDRPSKESPVCRSTSPRSRLKEPGRQPPRKQNEVKDGVTSRGENLMGPCGNVEPRVEAITLEAHVEAERKAREGAERAMAAAQHQVAQLRVERDRLASVVNSFGGRTLEEITAEANSLRRSLEDARSEAADLRSLADAKASEALASAAESLELRQALSREESARGSVEERVQSLSQDLRTSLRQSARSKEALESLSLALKKSESQRESLSQRLGVLRSTNQRLEKKLAAPARGGAG
ncbi:unnamed protein product, partial [Discosporangium mesarthrocarpum]